MRYLCFLAFLLIPGLLPAQSLPLDFSSYPIKLCVAKDQSLTLTTRAGEVGLTGSIKGNWHRVDVQKESGGSGPLLDQSNFFNKDTGFVSGFINTPGGKYNIIYHTTNGGQQWNAINFGQDGWVDDAVNLDNGEAWLSVAGSGIAYTSDYGFTWNKFKNPEVKQRFSAIFFNTARQGLIGSLWNMIAYTNDNCGTWKLLPTPLDQKKYNKTNKESRPEFDRVAIYKNYFLARQEDLVFYTKRDSINWVWMPEYSNFYTDPENSTLFFMTRDEDYIRADSNFIPGQVFENLISGHDAKCKNGSLFIVGDQRMIQVTARNEVLDTSFVTTGATMPASIGYVKKGAIGVLDSKVFFQKSFEGAWDSLFTFPFTVEKGALSVVSEDLLMYNRGDDSLFYFNLNGKMKRAISKTAMMKSFADRGIKKLIFSSGSRGCFHNYADQVTYANLGKEFGNAVETNHGAGPEARMPDNDQTIETDVVNTFAGKVPQLFDPGQMATIQELNFSEEEYRLCKKDISYFKYSLPQEGKGVTFSFPRNNLDFNRLLGLVDSIKSIGSEKLNASLMNLSTMWSTTTNWKTIELVNKDGVVLSIECNYYEPNAFYFPWSISLNGYSIFTTNMAVNRFIQQVYPAFLNDASRIQVLHKLVKDLY